MVMLLLRLMLMSHYVSYSFSMFSCFLNVGNSELLCSKNMKGDRWRWWCQRNIPSDFCLLLQEISNGPKKDKHAISPWCRLWEKLLYLFPKHYHTIPNFTWTKLNICSGYHIIWGNNSWTFQKTTLSTGQSGHVIFPWPVRSNQVKGNGVFQLIFPFILEHHIRIYQDMRLSSGSKNMGVAQSVAPQIQWHPYHSCLTYFNITIWLFNIAMENHQL